MTETPRQYKKRIDEKRKKNAENRDKLIQQIEKYELVDEDFKAKTKQEILDNFEKNLNAEKNGELYLTVGKELESIELKYKELEELNENLKIKKQESSDLEKQLMEQNMNGTDKTTLKLQMLNLKKIKTKLDTVKKEIKEMEKEIENRENELKEIEETYGKKEEVVSSDDKDTNKEGINPPEESTKKDTEKKPETLQEYKEKVLIEKGKIEHTKGEILKLLDEGTGIDESLKQKIESKVSDTFAEYDAEQEGTLRMKAARYLEKRDDIFDEYIFRKGIWEIGGKIAYREKNKEGKYCIMRGDERISDRFDFVGHLVDIGGKPAFEAVDNNGKCAIFRGNKQYSDWFRGVLELKDIGGKPTFSAINDYGKGVIFRGDQQCGEGFKFVGDPVDVRGKPAFIAKNDDGKECIFRGNEQFVNRVDKIHVSNYSRELRKIIQENCNDAEKENISNDNHETETMEDSPREKREEVILDWYQKKLNRDELLKIISGIDGINEDTKNKLEKQILRSFYDEFKKVISDEDFQEWDKQYRTLKKTQRKNRKKIKEIDSEKGDSMSEIKEIDARLYEITGSAMNLEDESRWKILKKGKLNKAKDEWNDLEIRQNEIIEGVRKLNIEKKKLELDLSNQNKKYGVKKERSVIKGKSIQGYEGVGKQDLKQTQTLKGYKEKYATMIADKEKYMEDLLKQIESVDLGINDVTKKKVIEILKLGMAEEIKNLRQGDELLKLANETEKWLKENLETMMQEMEDLSLKIKEKEAKIAELKSRGKRNNSDEIFEIKEQEFNLRNELVELESQYEAMKSKIDEDLRKYNGSNYEEKKVEIELKKMLGADEVKNCGVIGGKLCFRMKNSNGEYIVCWGDWHSGRYREIGEIKDVLGNPCFKVKDRDGDYRVIWGDDWCGDGYKEIGEIKDVGGKPCFTVKERYGDYRVYWGDWFSDRGNEIGEIKDIGGEPCFKVKDRDGDRVFWGHYCYRYCYDGYKEIGEIKDIGGKPCFKVKDSDGDYCVYWGEYCYRYRYGGYKEIGEIKDIGGKPCFKVKDRDGDYKVFWGEDWSSDRYREIGEIKDIGGMPCFKVKDRDGTYRFYRLA